jgi:hypothetical protein
MCLPNMCFSVLTPMAPSLSLAEISLLPINSSQTRRSWMTWVDPL